VSSQQTRALLRLLLENGIDHVVVGGVAAIAWGASELTRDLDIVIPYGAEDIATLLAALAPHHPKHATRPDLGVIRDTADRLATFRMLLIETDLGRLDVLPGCEPVGDFARLRGRAASIRLDDGEHYIIALDDLIAVKEHVARPKDMIVALQLKAIRARMRHSEASSNDTES
jgi:predicted nucleotidyltransferase